jgi:hypothetical protein
MKSIPEFIAATTLNSFIYGVRVENFDDAMTKARSIGHQRGQGHGRRWYYPTIETLKLFGMEPYVKDGYLNARKIVK